MRIAYLVSRFPAFSETFVVREVVEVRRRGHAVQVYALKSRTDPGYDPSAEHLVRSTQYSRFLLSGPLLWANLKAACCRPVRYWGSLLFVFLHGLRTPKECLKALAAYPKTVYYGALMAERGVEHIHVHFANVPTLSALVIRRIFGIPYSFFAHAHDLYQFRSMLAEKLAGATFALTNCEFNRDYLARFCEPEDMKKVSVLHCGGDVRRLSRVERHPEPGLVVSLGRLCEQKGFVYLVEACAALRRRGMAVRFEVAGEGPDRPMLQQRIAELGVGDAFVLLGRIPDIESLLARAALFALPCVVAGDGSMDGIPTVLIEAMAAKVPVVSTMVSGVPELVRNGETGRTVPANDAEALADAIETVLNDPEGARRMAEKGCELVCQSYDLHKNAGTVVEMLERISR